MECKIIAINASLTPSGTEVVFKWQGSFHNVVKIGSADDYTNCNGITNTAGADGSSYSWVFLSWDPACTFIPFYPYILVLLDSSYTISIENDIIVFSFFIPNATGASGPFKWTAPANEGSHYFVCGIGIHCTVGNMKAAIEVSNNCPWTFYDLRSALIVH